MKRQQLAYLRVVALMMTGMLAMLTLCNLFTIATKSISVDIPSEEDIHWSIDPLQKELLFRTSFSVKNQGAYDIKDIDILAHLVKDGGTTPLISFEKQDLVVLRGTNTTIDVLIPINLDAISWFDWLSIMYQNTTLRLLLSIKAQYMVGLIKFTADEAIPVPWSPPLLALCDNATARLGMNSLLAILNIAQNGLTASLTDMYSLASLSQISYTNGNGFAFSLVISNYSEFLKNITFHIIAPLLVIDGGFEFTLSMLVGFDNGSPLLRIQEVRVEYVP